jgi:hypothetical protein
MSQLFLDSLPRSFMSSLIIILEFHFFQIHVTLSVPSSSVLCLSHAVMLSSYGIVFIKL